MSDKPVKPVVGTQVLNPPMPPVKVMDAHQAAGLYQAMDALRERMDRHETIQVYSSAELVATSVQVRQGAVRVIGWSITNMSAAGLAVKLYDRPSAAAVGVDKPRLTLALPTLKQAEMNMSNYPIPFGQGLCIAATTGVADTDTTAPSAGAVVVNIFFI